MGNDDWRYFHFTLKSVYHKCVMISSDEKLNDLLTLFPPELKGVPTFGFLTAGGIALSRFYEKGIFRRSICYEENCVAIKRRFLLPGSWYCMFFVVDSRMQGQGRGTHLFKPVLKVLAEEGHPVYLETHKAVNTEIYRHMPTLLHFTIRLSFPLSKLFLPGSLPLDLTKYPAFPWSKA